MNRTSISVLSLSVVATAATEKHLFLESDGSFPSSGGNALGTTQRAAKAGEHVSVLVLGKGIAVADSAISVGTLLKTTAAGKVRSTTGSSTAVGRALTAAAADEEIEYIAIAN